jgi:Immunity protein 42
MMPVVGDPSRFAVEYALNENHRGAWMFGRFCYWCAGRRAGDYELGTSLRDVLFRLDELARDESARGNRRFSVIPASEVFRLLDGALFGASDLNNATMAEEEQWARHIIFPPVDIFDRWKGFLVEEQQIARLIFATDPYEEVSELLLEPGEVDSVLNAARKALNDMNTGNLLPFDPNKENAPPKPDTDR